MKPKKRNKELNFLKRKLLHATPYLNLYETFDHFYYAERKGVDSIAALCFKVDKKGTTKFYVHYQVMPQIIQKQHEFDMYACPITGSMEVGENSLACAIREVYEEGGIQVGVEHLRAMTKALATTQMNEQVHHFLFDVSELKVTRPKTDGSYFEQFAENKWLTQEQLEKLIFESSNVKLSSLLICYLMWCNVKQGKYNIQLFPPKPKNKQY